jgi:protein TonB
VQVLPAGAAGRVDLETSSGSAELDNAAIAAVKNWRFEPARRGAEAVEATVIVPIVFRLVGG